MTVHVRVQQPGKHVDPVRVAVTGHGNGSTNPLFRFPPPYRSDYYVCTGCGTHSCGGVYSSLCPNCNGVISNPPRGIRHQYLCHNCARQYEPCVCDHPPTPDPVEPFRFRDPPEYCWCKCCTCCTYSCSCSCCNFFCECLSAQCRSFEPCCYCTRVCYPNEDRNQALLCYWL